MVFNSWRPTAILDNIKKRAELLTKIRHFFAERSFLEVETPMLSHSTVTDPNIHSFVTNYLPIGVNQSESLYLQTSPEFAMKRLLASGSGSIYQICKAFRNGESGSYHNPEFTILEWYHVGFNHHDLMAEMNDFLMYILGTKRAQKISYQEAFLKYLQVDPLNCGLSDLENCAKTHGLSVANSLTFDEWLNILLAEFIEPNLGSAKDEGYCPCFLYDFPASQSALARISPNNSSVAERFEVYINGIELANGFHELTLESEQRLRFQNDLIKRQKLNLASIPLDEYFLGALANGLPDCAGVALGIDRLLMIATGAKCLQEVITFPLENA